MTPRFFTLFSLQVVRNVLQHRLLAALNVLGIALGIAVYLAIQIANGSANRSFAAGVDLAAGKAHLEVRGAVDETLWPLIARQPGVKAATALVEGVVTLPDFPGEYLRVLGVDLFTNAPFSTFELNADGRKVDFQKWLATPGAVALSKEFAVRQHLPLGSRVRVLANSKIKELSVEAVMDFADSLASAQPRFAAMDLGWAQELLGSQGRLSSVQLILEHPEDAGRIAQSLRALLPSDLQVEAPQQRSFQMQHMIAAFQLNLTALSMVSLLVGIFLIYTTVSASVIRRRNEIGILRALGASRAEVRCLFLGEALLSGGLGIALGCFAGVGLARLLVGAVAKTISSLYLLLSIENTHFEVRELLVAAAFGLGAVLLGAWLPAHEAAGIAPLAALSPGAQAQNSRTRVYRWHWLGVLCLGAAWLASWGALAGGPAALGFVAAFFVLIAFALFSPGATVFFGEAAVRGNGILWRLGAENLTRSVHRNGVTVAALAVAVAMMTGLMIMIFSFRNSVEVWVDRTLVADLFVAPGSNETIGHNASIPQDVIAWWEAQPGVDAVDTMYEKPVFIGAEPALLAVVKGADRHNLQFVGGGAEGKSARVLAGAAVAVSESFARKFHVADGGRVTLNSPGGVASFEVAGIYADYSRDQGVVLMARGLFGQFWNEPQVHSLSVYLQPGFNPEPLIEAFTNQFSQGGQLAVYSNGALRQRILKIFDQTFMVTHILRTIAVLVALVGIFLTVSTLVIERSRDIAVLRAIGASRAQIQGLLMSESAMIGALASALGLAAGALLSLVLTWVVNPAFFGWTIQLQFPWGALLATPFWMIPAAIVAAWYPAWRASHVPIAKCLRGE